MRVSAEENSTPSMSFAMCERQSSEIIMFAYSCVPKLVHDDGYSITMPLCEDTSDLY